MNEYHDRSVDDPHPAVDRPVAGWRNHDRDDAAGERELPAEDEPREGEAPLVGAVWNRDDAGHETNPFSEAEYAGETGAETARTGENGHVTEPFGTEEPMVVSEPADAQASQAGTFEHVEDRPAADTEDTVDTAETPAVAEPAATADGVATEGAGGVAAEGARPATSGEFTVDHLVEPAAAERLRDRWREVKLTFVDDPSDAVRQAGDLAGEAVEELTAALGRLRQELDGNWSDGDDADTERLRVALRGYGSLIDRILAH